MKKGLDRLEELRKRREELELEKEELKKQIVKINQEQFSEQASPLFEKHPKLKSWQWYQYTPYFNDGDVCEFKVHDYYIDVEFDGFPKEELNDSRFAELNDNSFDEAGNYKKYARNYKTGNYDSTPIPIPGLAEAHCDIRILMDTIKEDAEDMFGDHVKVVVSRDGVDVVKHEHE